MNDKSGQPGGKSILIVVSLVCIVAGAILIIRSLSPPRRAEYAPDFQPPSKHAMQVPQSK